jgi:arylsulfatase A-like enzyme
VIVGQAVVPALAIIGDLSPGRSLAIIPPALGLAALSFALLASLVGAGQRPLTPRVASSATLGSSAILLAVWLYMFHQRPPLALALAMGLAYLLLLYAASRANRWLRPGLPTLLLCASAFALPLGPSLWNHVERERASMHPLRPIPNGDQAAWPAERPRQVILLTADTFRGDLLGGRDGAGPLTPNLDRLAARSVLFTEAISASCWTKPAFASLMSGLEPAVHQVLTSGTPLPREITTLAERLQAAGYVTAAFQGNPQLRRTFHFDQGFSTYRTISGHWGDSVGALLLDRWISARRHDTTHLLTAAAIDWIETNQERPFFLWLHYLDPHMSYRPPPEFIPAKGLAATIGQEFSDLNGVREGRKLSADERATIATLYRAEARYVDAEIGRFLAAVEGSGLADEMLLVFTSDHGEEFWEHSGFEHGHSFHRELLHVPLLFKLPASSVRASLGSTVATSRVAATILDLTAIATPDSALLAPSLRPHWNSASSPAETPSAVVSQGALYFEDGIALTLDGMKYIQYLTSGREELFDLGSDPGEQLSVALQRPAAIDSAQQLLQEYLERSQEIRDSLGLRQTVSGQTPARLRRELEALGYVQ